MPRRAAQNEATVNSLEIQLIEPVVFLRRSERRRRRDDPLEVGYQSSGTPVRGVLALNLANEDQISSIEVELEGRATTTWIESTQ